MLAPVSASPGATRQINFFDLAGRFFLVDLPGYGFAQVSRSLKESSAYLRGRPTLKRVCVLIDSRHGVKDSDHETGPWTSYRGLLVIQETTSLVFWSGGKTG